MPIRKHVCFSCWKKATGKENIQWQHVEHMPHASVINPTHAWKACITFGKVWRDIIQGTWEKSTKADINDVATIPHGNRWLAIATLSCAFRTKAKLKKLSLYLVGLSYEQSCTYEHTQIEHKPCGAGVSKASSNPPLEQNQLQIQRREATNAQANTQVKQKLQASV